MSPGLPRAASQRQRFPITQPPRPQASGSPGLLPILRPSHPFSLSPPPLSPEAYASLQVAPPPLPPCPATHPTATGGFLKSRTDPVTVLVSSPLCLPAGFTHHSAEVTHATVPGTGAQQEAEQTEPCPRRLGFPKKRQTVNEHIKCEGARAGRVRLSGYGAAMVGGEVILDRWSQVSQEETSEQRPAWSEGGSPTARESSASQAERAACKGPAAAAGLARGRAGPGEQAGRGEPGDMARRGWWGGRAPGMQQNVLKTQRGHSQQGSVRAPASLGQALGCPEVPLPEDQEEAGTPALFPAATSTRHRLAHCPHPTDARGDWREHLVPKRRTRCPWSPWHQGEEPGFTPRSV